MTVRWRGWALYSVAWLAVFIGYTQLLTQMVRLPLAIALYSSLDYTLSAAALGVAVWWTAGRFVWPDTKGVRFILLQVVFALVYSMVWHGCIIVCIGLQSSWSRAWSVSQAFFGWQFFMGLWVYGVIAGVSHALRATGRLREREAAAARAESLRMHAELQALRGQLNPHFLFNTLHTVSALMRQDPYTAESILERFAGLLRYVLDTRRLERDDVTLSEELSFVRDYLALEQIRLGERLVVREDIDPEALDIALPSLSLQPLVENAIVHAVSPRAGGATITIRAALSGDELVVTIADDGPGGTPSAIHDARGLGLRVGRQRIETRYNGKARFTIDTAPGAGFTVTLALPAYFRTAEHTVLA
jgi:sensor histidine kinase YesM